MKQYYRLMLGSGGKHFQECFQGNYIGVDYEVHQDLTPDLSDDWRKFNQKFVPKYLEIHPEKTRVAAGLAMGAVHTVAKGIKEGDIVLSSDGSDVFKVAEVIGPYYYQAGGNLPHRRTVRWIGTIDRQLMSDNLQASLRTVRVVSNISSYASQLEDLLTGKTAPLVDVKDETILDPYEFVMERHLEDFLVQNWSRTLLGREYRIFEDEGETIGQQYQTDSGPIDILAISRDNRTLLVVELKKGRANDVVAGQILRYMGYVREELAETGQQVKGLIIAAEEDLRLKRALAVVPDISFMRYSVNFKLEKV